MIDFDNFQQIIDRKFWRCITRDTLCPVGEQSKDKLLRILYDSIVDKTYYPSPPREYLVSHKSQKVARIVPVFEIKDYCLYYFCVKRLEDFLTKERTPNTFGGWRLSNNFSELERQELERRYPYVDPEYFSEGSFNPLAWVKFWGEFTALLYSTLEREQEGFIVEFDISNFYDCVRLDILENNIRSVSPAELQFEVSLLMHFLKYWNRKFNSYHPQSAGIPQDESQDCSRILANFYLQAYDKKINRLCSGMGARYFRYADDQVIFAENKLVAGRLLFEASKELSKIGLNINTSKVKEFSSKKDYANFWSFDIHQNLGRKDIKNAFAIWKDRKDKIDGFRNYPSIIKRFISNDLSVLDLNEYNMIMTEALSREMYSVYDSRQLKKIYLKLHEDEKRKFINELNQTAKVFPFNKFHFILKKFFSEFGFDCSDLDLKINELRL